MIAERKVWLPRGPLKNSVFDPNYSRNNLDNTTYTSEQVEFVIDGIRQIYEADRDEYYQKSLDAQTKYPIRYNEGRIQRLGHMPAWQAVIIGEESSPILTKPRDRGLSLGRYTLRQSLYFACLKPDGRVYSKIYGELRPLNKDANQGIFSIEYSPTVEHMGAAIDFVSKSLNELDLVEPFPVIDEIATP